MHEHARTCANKVQSFPIYIVGFVLSCSAIGGMLTTFFMSSIIDKIGDVKAKIIGLSIYMLANLEVAFWTSDIDTTQIILNSISNEFFTKIYIE